MKSLREMRASDIPNVPAAAEVVDNGTPAIYDNDGEADATGHTLIALNHIATMADDLYTAVGDEGIELLPEEIDAILNSFDLISSIHDKHSELYDMPSQSYDEEDLAGAMDEENQLQKEELELAESLAWQTMVKSLGVAGFKMMPPEKFASGWKPSSGQVHHMFGIQMRAGKFADTYFAITDNEAKPYTIVNVEGTTSYAELGQALAAIKKLTKTGTVQEGVSDEEHAISDKFVPTPWDIIEALGDEETIRRMNRIKEFGVGLAQDVIVEHMIEEIKTVDLNLSKAIGDFYSELKEASNPAHGFAVRYSVFSKKGDGPIVHKEMSFPTAEKMEKWMDTAEDKVPYFHEIQSTSYPRKNEDLDEMVDIAALWKKVKEFIGQGWELQGYKGYQMSADVAHMRKGKLAKHITAKGEIQWPPVKKESADLVENKTNSVLTWDGAKGQMDPFRLEVIGQDGSVVARLLDKVLPAGKGNVYDDQIGFKSTKEREAAAKALTQYFKAVKEQDLTIIDLGDLNEAFDETKFKRLAMTGLVPAEEVNGVVRAMKALEAGKTLTPAQKDLISGTFLTLIGLVTGDTSVFSKIQGAAKKAVSEEATQDLDRKQSNA
jgi:hypothetical protein